MPENKNIAFVNSNKSWGGGEKWHFDIAKILWDKGYSVLFVINRNSNLLEKLSNTDIPYIMVPVSNYSFLNLIKIQRLSRIFTRHHIHTVIMNLPSDVKVAGPAARRAGVKKVIYRRGTALPVHNNVFNRYLFKKVITYIITNSYETKKMLLRKNPNLVDENKIKIIYNGLDFNEFDNRPVRQSYAKRNSELVLGNLGRFVEQKGHRLLIDVAKKLKNSKVPFRLLLAGEGKLKGSIIKLARKEGVYDNLVFTGFVTDVKSFMASIDIFLLTSLWEGFGYVIVEAMAGRKPVIAFNISSNPEIIQNAKNGFLVPFPNTDAFVKKILMLYHDKQLRQQMGENARQSAVEKFNIGEKVREIEKLLG